LPGTDRRFKTFRELIGQIILKKSKEIFEEIALPNLNAVFRAAFALCGKARDAEDLAQDTFVKAFEHFESFKPGTNCKAWLLRILRNTWIDRLRRQQGRGQILPLEQDLVAEPARPDEIIWSNAEDLVENFSDEQIIKALKQLPDDQRLTLFLIDVEQLGQQEVAEITGVAVGTVKSRTSRARAALKEKLIAYAGRTEKNRS
jgi:RNA polymerase sigma-70 factor (ECF subfamily)